MCGTLFTPSRSDADYWSPACRQNAYRARKSRAAPVRLVVSGTVDLSSQCALEWWPVECGDDAVQSEPLVGFLAPDDILRCASEIGMAPVAGIKGVVINFVN